MRSSGSSVRRAALMVRGRGISLAQAPGRLASHPASAANRAALIVASHCSRQSRLWGGP
jgi:hypothetical protein